MTPERLAKIVREKQGCKATELVSFAGEESPNVDLSDVIEEAVKRRLIIELEYVLPNMQYRVKSYLFPAGTCLRINQ